MHIGGWCGDGETQLWRPETRANKGSSRLRVFVFPFFSFVSGEQKKVWTMWKAGGGMKAHLGNQSTSLVSSFHPPAVPWPTAKVEAKRYTE
ncbi:hypothetical protein XA68_14357 [Ophiocordyceps unilateralis]|uniref:Uncharacterized protein n=1 Tax=Ophiocordyceps unilateralis TaxID=268505 RepID=A0A2A9P953_OPHUN|nr:hypothetical protein XA68_14357 [Ophiocordyceps unilateralis]